MHVVYVIDHLGPGGAQRQAVELAVHLAARGLRVGFLVYHPLDFFGERLRDAGVPVLRVPKRAKLDPTLPGRMARRLEAEGADVVHAFMAVPTLWAGLALRRLRPGQRPLLIGAERNGRVAATPLQRCMESFAYRRCDTVTVNAHPMLEAVHTELGVPRERIQHLPNGIDLAAWDGSRARPCPVELDPHCFHVVVIGRLEWQKGHSLLLEALARLESARIRGWRVWLVGPRTGPRGYAASLEEQCRSLGLRDVVRFLPAMHDVPALLSRVDALVLASRWEGFPNVVLEAMASELPIVATRVGDVPTMLADGETGLLVDPDDAESLADGLRRLSALDPTERRNLGLRARKVVEERYEMDAVAERHLALYERLHAAVEPGK